MMPAAGPRHHARGRAVYAIPDGEELLAVLLSLERFVQHCEHLIRPPHVCSRERASAQDVADRDGKKRRVEAMAGHVDEVKREVVIINPVIADGVASERR